MNNTTNISEPIFITKQQAIRLLPKSKKIHVYRNYHNKLVEFEYDDDFIVDLIYKSQFCELSGPKATKVNHGLCVYPYGASQAEKSFIQTDINRLNALKRELAIIKNENEIKEKNNTNTYDNNTHTIINAINTLKEKDSDKNNKYNNTDNTKENTKENNINSKEELKEGLKENFKNNSINNNINMTNKNLITWISVRKEMPKENQLVLAFSPTDNSMYVAYAQKWYRNDKIKWYLKSATGTTKYCINKKITHWAYLPNIPNL